MFTLDPRSGSVHFGDGTHGAIPPRGRTVTASYRTVHQGYFAFARAMKEVDPSIDVCSSWGNPTFDRVVGHRRYDCLTAHAITVFTSPRGHRPRWSGPLEGHDRFILKSDSAPTRIRELRQGMPPATPLLLTEFVAMHGDPHAYPTWASSLSHAVYMASLWAAWLKIGIRWGDGDDFLWSSDRAVLGPAPRYVFTADALTRQALSPMFSAGGSVLATRVSGNPVRHPPRAPGRYAALSVAATRAHGVVRVLLVNRLPLRRVTAHLALVGARLRGTAIVRSVTGPSYTSRNDAASPHRVALHVRSRPARASSTYVLPPASITVVQASLR